MKLFICGHGRHGKDTAAEILRDELGVRFESSSLFCAEKIVKPYLDERCIMYDSAEERYNDRHNHRELWFEAIREFTKDDPTRLSRELFKVHDIYVGIRSREEFLASKYLADVSIWVDASKRLDYIDPTCEILESDCDITITNNGTLEAFKSLVIDTYKTLDFIK